MIRIRYYKLRFGDLSPTESIALFLKSTRSREDISVTGIFGYKIFATIRTTKEIKTVHFANDGTAHTGFVTTMEQHYVRLLATHSELFLGIIDPPKGLKAIIDLISEFAAPHPVYSDALNISRKLIDAHTKNFDASKLVSAKVKNFQVYEKAVGRLEVTSREGITDDIAPFLSGKYYTIDSLTYEVIFGPVKYLINYNSNGALKISTGIFNTAIEKFENILD